jgi:galactokinase
MSHRQSVEEEGALALAERARRAFFDVFGRAPRQVALAPGRVNLIGEHTDYNDGFVLPMAIDRHVAVAFAPRADRILRVHATSFEQTRQLSLDELETRARTEPEKRSGRGGWFAYIVGVAWAMLGAGEPLRGANLAIVSDLPTGAGLSSSAAVEIAVARALAAVADLDWDPRAIAQLAQRAEQAFAGVACGIMDQLAVAAAGEGCALLIDCRSLDTRDVPLPSSARIVVFDTGVRRELSGSAYNERRAACERVVEGVRRIDPRVRALRDVDEALLAAVAASLDPVDVRRATHVIAENRRPAELANAFAANDLRRAGRLMVNSHDSLRDLYEVSSRGLDAIVEAAVSAPGCYGARLTGAGFGGCAIALVEAGSIQRVTSAVEAGYEQRTGRLTTGFVCRAADGAAVIGVDWGD